MKYFFILLSLITAIASFGQQDTSNLPNFKTEEELTAYFDFLSQDSIKRLPTAQKIIFNLHGIAAAERFEIDTLIGRFSFRLGNYYSDLDSVSKALFYLHQTHTISKEYNMVFLRHLVTNGLGILYSTASDKKRALTYFFESADVVKKSDEVNTDFAAYPLGNVSGIYERLDDMDNAIKYVYEANKHTKNLPFPRKEYNYALNYVRLHEYYRKSEVLDSTEIYINKAIEEMAKIDTIEDDFFKSAAFWIYEQATYHYLKNRQFEIAALYIQKTNQFKDYISPFYFALLQAKYALTTKDYRNCNQILDTLKVIHPIEKKKLLELKLEYYETIKDYEGALGISKELAILEEEIQSEDQKRFAAFADAEYEVEQQEEEIRRLRQEKQIDKLTIKNQHNFFTAVLSLLVLLIGGLFFFYYQNKQRKANEERVSKLLEELKIVNKELEQSNKDLNQFAYSASHDLQEPLRTVGSFVDLLMEENEDKFDEESQVYADYITDGVVRMRALIDALLTYAKVGNTKIQLQSIDPENIINTKLQDLFVKIKETNTTVTVHHLPKKIMAEPNQLGIVFFNLINNGIKFNKSSNPKITINSEERANDFLFSIKDNGIGIDPKNHNKIFEIFKRLHRKEDYKGTGIGLASVRKIIEKHKGEIWVKSDPDSYWEGKGTTFFFTIPKVGKANLEKK